MRFGLTPIKLALFKLNRIQHFWQALNGGVQKVTIIIIWAFTQHSNSQITVMFKATFSSDSSLHIIIFIESISVEQMLKDYFFFTVATNFSKQKNI